VSETEQISNNFNNYLTNITSGGGVINTQTQNSNPRSSENGTTPKNNIIADNGSKTVVSTAGGVSLKDLKTKK